MEFKSGFKPNYIIDEERTIASKEFMRQYNTWCSYFVDNIIALSVAHCGFSLQAAARAYAGLSDVGFAKLEEDKIAGVETFSPRSMYL